MAIKSIELRIGNLIQYNEGGECKVIGIYEFGIDVEFPEETTYIEYDQFSPIQLTEELLLKFGLTNVTEELDTEKSFEIQFGRKAFRVVIDDRGLCTVIYQVDIGMNFQELTDIEFVHEFQNLIFALCGEELKLK